MPPDLQILDLGLLPYRPAWDRQLALHAQVLDGSAPAGFLLLVEHPPVITIGRHPNSARHLLASSALLASRGVDVVETDRGGDITFHGPGQLVAYPIISLNYYHLNLHAYMRLLEETVIRTLARFGIASGRLEGATGVWTNPTSPTPPKKPTPYLGWVQPATTPLHLAKICAMGVKLRRWTTLHGLALNLTTDLSFFDLINPCGLGRPVTSLAHLLGPRCPTMSAVKTALIEEFRTQLAAAPNPDPATTSSTPSEPRP